MLNLEPIPYGSQPLAQWCINYLHEHEDIVSDIENSMAAVFNMGQEYQRPRTVPTGATVALRPWTNAPGAPASRRRKKSTFWTATKGPNGEWTFDPKTELRFGGWASRLLGISGGRRGSTSTSHHTSTARTNTLERPNSGEDPDTVRNVFIYTIVSG